MSDVEKNIGTHKPEFDGEWVRLTELCKPNQWKTIPRASLKQDELAAILCQALGVTPLRPSESFRRRQIDLRKVLLAGWWGEGV